MGLNKGGIIGPTGRTCTEKGHASREDMPVREDMQ